MFSFLEKYIRRHVQHRDCRRTLKTPDRALYRIHSNHHFSTMGKITRVRTGCWTCKKRHRKCDEGKPSCNNCIKSNRKCEGYEIRLSFDVDDQRNNSRKNNEGYLKHSFVGRPRGTRPVVVKPKNEDHQSKKLNSVTELSQSKRNTSNDTPNTPEVSNETHTVFADVMALENQTNLAPSISELPLLDSIPSGAANLESFGLELFEGLEYLLKSPIASGAPNILVDNFSIGESHIAIPRKSLETSSSIARYSRDKDAKEFKEAGSNHKEVSAILLDGGEILDLATTDSSLSYEEENMMLRHFFKTLLPILDAHPNSPWPDLVLKYCDFDIARSCFISLACIHIYESRKGGSDYYRKGMVHINKTLDYLLGFINSNEGRETHKGEVATLESTKKRMISSFVIIVLINVHILFTVVDKGLSTFLRFFFKVFASVCQDAEFYELLLQNEKRQSLAVVLSWYDTVSAIVTPDCRRPFCSPDWYGSAKTSTLTAKMMGCPGEVFQAMSLTCIIRHEIYEKIKEIDPLLDAHGEDSTEVAHVRLNYLGAYLQIHTKLLSYREAVEFGDDFSNRLKAAQCWALAVHLMLNKTVRPSPDYKIANQALLHEFIDVYGTLPELHPVRTQMVWPMYIMGCECRTEYEQECLKNYLDVLYLNTNMGTNDTLRNIVFQVWKSGETCEAVIRRWYDEGVDYLPL